MEINLNQRVIEWLLENPEIKRLYAQFGDDALNGALLGFVTDPPQVKTYTSGEKIKIYTFALQITKSVSKSTVQSTAPHLNENIANYCDVESVMGWVEEQNRLKHYPDFSPYRVFKVEVLQRNPQFVGETANKAFYMSQFRVHFWDDTEVKGLG